MMNTGDLKKYVPKGYFPVIFDEAGSTNDIAKALASEGAPELTVVIAGRQTSGRGRKGRKFFSPDKGGLYLSILLRPEKNISDALMITTMTAAALSKAIEDRFAIGNGIKWVNDIYAGGKKVSGILTEGGFEGGRLSFAVVGVGINVSEPSGGFPEEISNVAGALFPFGEDRRGELLSAFLQNFAEFYFAEDPKAFTDEYRKRMLLYGKEVTVIRPDGTEKAVVSGLDESLGLEVIYPDGRKETLVSGEVSLKITD